MKTTIVKFNFNGDAVPEIKTKKLKVRAVKNGVVVTKNSILHLSNYNQLERGITGGFFVATFHDEKIALKMAKRMFAIYLYKLKKSIETMKDSCLWYWKNTS